MAAIVSREKRWHLRLLDWIDEFPAATIGQAAEHFGTTAAFIAAIKDSDAFKQVADKRRALLVEAQPGPMVALGLKERVNGLAEIVTDKIQQRVEDGGDDVPTRTLLDVLSTSAKVLGSDRDTGVGRGELTVNIGVVDAATLSLARQKMQQLGAVNTEEAGQLIDVTPSSS